jgi:hypothetical protein
LVDGPRPAKWPFQYSPDSDAVNDPAIIEYIRQKILIPPSEKPYSLDKPERDDTSEGRFISKFVVPKLLSNISVSKVMCMQNIKRIWHIQFYQAS